MQQAAFGGFRSLLGRFESEVLRPDLDKAAASMFCLFNMMLLGPMLHPEIVIETLTDGEAFSRELADFAYRYLTGAK